MCAECYAGQEIYGQIFTKLEWYAQRAELCSVWFYVFCSVPFRSSLLCCRLYPVPVKACSRRDIGLLKILEVNVCVINRFGWFTAHTHTHTRKEWRQQCKNKMWQPKASYALNFFSVPLFPPFPFIVIRNSIYFFDHLKGSKMWPDSYDYVSPIQKTCFEYLKPRNRFKYYIYTYNTRHSCILRRKPFFIRFVLEQRKIESEAEKREEKIRRKDVQQNPRFLLC